MSLGGRSEPVKELGSTCCHIEGRQREREKTAWKRSEIEIFQSCYRPPLGLKLDEQKGFSEESTGIDFERSHCVPSTSPVETGSYVVEIGAVDRESNALLAQTQLEIRVIGGAEPEKKMFSQSFFTRTLDRESSPEFLVPFKLRKDSVVVVESLFALDENGQQKEFKKSDVSIDRHSVSFKRGALGALRVVSVELASEGEKATVTLSLSSTPQFIENQRKESTRPLFPHPWTRESPMISLSIPEELPLGTAVFSLPAVNPVDGTLVSLSIHGDMKDFFAVDSSTGSISIAQRLDVDSMPASDRTFSLRLVAGADDYESEAVLRITLVNIDDNAPILEKGGLDNEIPIPENLPPLTTIARFAVGDRDELDNTDEFTIEKSGLGSQQYSVSIVNGSLVVAVAANGTLDREQMQTHTIHLTVRDAARNQDSATLHVLLLDENDNAPRFSKDQYAVQVVDNWPVGVVIDRLFASDDDTGNNANVVYSLASGNRKCKSLARLEL
ncbi:unnamed protein product [Heligmosomoides polygyrus]|uniref:Cadherin domain protein n=1 Tax=Heligmosomoides polygyrus TaxID=6339 RepID=A0A183F3M0_HELPZ|nr:unnamed protein product [Heligmosomoides polygyrus]